LSEYLSNLIILAKYSLSTFCTKNK